MQSMRNTKSITKFSLDWAYNAKLSLFIITFKTIICIPSIYVYNRVLFISNDLRQSCFQ